MLCSFCDMINQVSRTFETTEKITPFISYILHTVIPCKIFCLPVCYQKNIIIKIYVTNILRAVLYGCETYFLTLTEEDRLRVFENRVLSKMFGPKMNEVTEKWRRLHEKELYNL